MLESSKVTVGVVIPCFNRVKTLRSAVLSVLEQTGCPSIHLDVVVVDDGSTDDSILTIQDLPVKIIKTAGRMGACHARNLGVENLSSDWIMFNDSDDLWLPNKIELIYSELTKSDVDWIVHRFIRFAIDGEGEGSPQMPVGQPLPALLKRNFVSTQCIAVRRDVLISLNGFDETLPRFQDWDLAIRLAASGARHCLLNAILCVCVEQSNSISKSYRKGVMARSYLLRKHSGLFKKDVLSAAVFVFDLGIRRALLSWHENE